MLLYISAISAFSAVKSSIPVCSFIFSVPSVVHLQFRFFKRLVKISPCHCKPERNLPFVIASLNEVKAKQSHLKSPIFYITLLSLLSLRFFILLYISALSAVKSFFHFAFYHNYLLLIPIQRILSIISERKSFTIYRFNIAIKPACSK